MTHSTISRRTTHKERVKRVKRERESAGVGELLLFSLLPRKEKRQHAALTRGGAGIYLVDQSVHGVQVDTQRIEKNLRVLLKNGAMIKFGASTRLYVYHEPT